MYSDGEGIEKISPFDILPRIITATEWSIIERGIKQRVKALNIFLADVYDDQFIIKDGKIPAALILSCPNFMKEMVAWTCRMESILIYPVLTPWEIAMAISTCWKII